MLPFEDRFTRQRQLREVGVAGQRQLEASEAILGTTRAEAVAADYLRRAGVRVTIGEPDLTPASSPPPMSVCYHAGPAAYLAGSMRALDHLRQVLGMGKQR